MASNYAKKLRDPRWQRKRLKILERDNFTCVLCKDNESTLHIHHFIYKNNKEPWEYNDDDLTTLCENCHEVVEKFKIKRNNNTSCVMDKGKNGIKTYLYIIKKFVIILVRQDGVVISFLKFDSDKFMNAIIKTNN